MNTTTLLRRAAWSALAFACIAISPAQAATSAPAIGGYGDLSQQWQQADEIEAWYGAMRRLREDFDQICGDTFCEGDYSNIEALRFVCSARSADGRIGRCVWSFAASNEEVDPLSGRVSVEARQWTCQLPLVPGTRARDLLAALSVPSPLYAALPGTQTAIYDALADCL